MHFIELKETYFGCILVGLNEFIKLPSFHRQRDGNSRNEQKKRANEHILFQEFIVDALFLFSSLTQDERRHGSQL